MKDVFDRYIENFSRFSHVELKFENQLVGHSITAIDKNHMPLGGGTHSDLNTARRIAVAECLERALVSKVKDQPNEFLTREYPTSCGFAAGFDVESTQSRAVCEGYERWLWEEWIDRGGYIPEVNVSPSEMTPIARLYKSEFDNVYFFKHSFISCEPPLEGTLVNFGVVIARRGDGVFAGSRVTFGDENLWEHGLIEAWRHLTIYKHHDANQYANIVHKRIFYFGNHGDEAFNTLPKNINNKMRKPKIRLLKEYETEAKNELFLWRCICADFWGWHNGTVNRFIY